MRRRLGKTVAFMERLERRWWVKVLLALATILTVIELVFDVTDLLFETDVEESEWVQTRQIVYENCLGAEAVQDCDVWTDNLMAAQYDDLRLCLGVGLDLPRYTPPPVETCVLAIQKIHELRATATP